MSRLTKWKINEHEAWQWDDGPIFVAHENEKNPRKWAVEYGKTIQHLETLKELADLSREKAFYERQIEELQGAKIEQELNNEVNETGKTDN